jgi:hypothetical protein
MQELVEVPKAKEIYEELQSWEWLYGSTPQFTN